MIGNAFFYLYQCPDCLTELILQGRDLEGWTGKAFYPPQHPHCYCSPQAEMILIDLWKV